jgi:hypothetical protein
MAHLSLEKMLVITKEKAGWDPVMSKDGRKLSKKSFGQRHGVAWLVDNRHSMEMSKVVSLFGNTKRESYSNDKHKIILILDA